MFKSSNKTSLGKNLFRDVSGFSLFELIVFIISTAIIYATAANRFAAYPVEAERANFTAISAQLQSAINMEMLIGVGFGNIKASAQMAGMNPMDFLLEAPSTYIGVLNGANTAGLDARTWHFDGSAGELVYRVSREGLVVLTLSGTETPALEIRFKIVADFMEFDSAGLPVASGSEGSGSGRTQRKFTGVALRPVAPFRWL
jgi:hypothetical protein